MLLCSGLSIFRKIPKSLSFSALPTWRQVVMSAMLVSLSACSLPLTPARQASISTEVFAAKGCAWLNSCQGSLSQTPFLAAGLLSL